jgi:hypothetical protein
MAVKQRYDPPQPVRVTVGRYAGIPLLALGVDIDDLIAIKVPPVGHIPAYTARFKPELLEWVGGAIE